MEWASSSSVLSFGVQTGTQYWANTLKSTDIKLWTSNALYECTIGSMAVDSMYSCNESVWTRTSGTICNDETSDYKLIIEHSTADGIAVDSAFLDLDDARYTMDAWCLPDNATILQYNKQHTSPYPTNICSSGYTAYTDLCIENETDACDPQRVMLYFDMNNPDGTSYDAQWVIMGGRLRSLCESKQ